jgi:hypothetical protein
MGQQLQQRTRGRWDLPHDTPSLVPEQVTVDEPVCAADQFEQLIWTGEGDPTQVVRCDMDLHHRSIVAPPGHLSATVESRPRDTWVGFTMSTMRTTLVLISGLLLAGAVAAPAAAEAPRPTTYIVSNIPGDTPEGIAVSSDGTMYVTSIGTGAVYRGNVNDPDLFIPSGADGKNQAAGVHADRWGRMST